MLLRPLDDGLLPVPFSERQDWYHDLPVDSDGHPTSELSHALLRLFFEQPQVCHDLEIIAHALIVVNCVRGSGYLRCST